jgi:acyl carrier protein
MLIRRLVQEFLDMYGTGALKPLERTVSATEEVRSTLQHLQHPVLNGDISVGTSQSVRLRPDASYLLVGGVGGLGRCLATWLVERGARHITFLSRSAGVSEQSKDVIRELECMGCSVVAVAGDVSNAADVFSAVRASKTPIAGVLQLAMVLEDSNLFQMTWEGWMAATKPKINGTWNLHRALEGQPLDFFWMSSSLFSAVEHPGQGNYGAANTFMEAFCQYRWSLGLPASVLNICAIDGVGFVAENPRARRKAKSQGVYFLGESEFLDFVELSIQCSAPAGSLHDGPLTAWSNPGQVLMGLRSDSPLDDPANRTNWRRDRRMGLYHNVRANSTAVAPQLDPLRAFLDMLADASNEEEVLTDPSVTQMLAMETGRKIHDLMLKPGELVDISVSLAQLGLDSLVATELRRWLQQAVGLSVSVLEIMRLESLAQLGTLIAVKLRGKQAETRSRNKV